MQKGALGLPASPHWRCDSSQRERTQRQPSAGSAETINQPREPSKMHTYSYLGTAGRAWSGDACGRFRVVHGGSGTVLRCYSS